MLLRYLCSVCKSLLCFRLVLSGSLESPELPQYCIVLDIQYAVLIRLRSGTTMGDSPSKVIMSHGRSPSLTILRCAGVGKVSHSHRPLHRPRIPHFPSQYQYVWSSSECIGLQIPIIHEPSSWCAARARFSHEGPLIDCKDSFDPFIVQVLRPSFSGPHS